MRLPIRYPLHFRHFAAGLLASAVSLVMPAAAASWEGLWHADQTLITIRVTRDADTFTVEPVESAGLVWTTRNGTIRGNTATIDVEYQGVMGKVMVHKVDDSTAVAHALSCMPDYHVLCALVKNQQARFLKIESPAAEAL